MLIIKRRAEVFRRDRAAWGPRSSLFDAPAAADYQYAGDAASS